MTTRFRTTHPVRVGNLTIGGDAPIVIQTMTDTPTDDVEQTIAQIQMLADAGAEVVRLTINTESAAKAVPIIRSKLSATGYDLPLIGDFHFNGHLLLQRFPACAKALDKYRINPGNAAFRGEKDDPFSAMIQIAIENDKPVRIGVNGGSLDKVLVEHIRKSALPGTSESDIREQALLASALESAETATKLGLPADHIILSVKVSDVPEMIRIYEKLSTRCCYPLHLGLTEAGMGDKGIIVSAIGLGSLLANGIGSTIRASITPTPSEPRTKEIQICQQILQSLHLRSFRPSVTACPGCGRTQTERHRKLAETVENYLTKHGARWRQDYPGSEKLKIAVMGCVVNGPGESKDADIGICLPGAHENADALLYADGEKIKKLSMKEIETTFLHFLETYVEKRF